MDFDRYFGLSTSSNDCHSTIKSQFGLFQSLSISLFYYYYFSFWVLLC